MKQFTSALPVFFVALIIGCSEDNSSLNSPTDSMVSESRIAKSVVPRQIRLNLLLRTPGEFNSFTEVTGVVEYATTIIPRDPIPPNPQFSIQIDLHLNAELRPNGFTEPVWRISGSTRDDVVPTNDDGRTGYLTKRYFVSGLNKWLCLSFTFTAANIELSRSWLELPKVVRDSDVN